MFGKPVKISEAIIPHGNAPRDLTDIELMKQHSKLIKILEV